MELERLISAFGLLAMICFAWLLSSNRRVINWRVIIGGLALQLIFAVLILKTTPGEIAFKGIGDFFTALIKYVDHGSRFMFDANREMEVPVALASDEHQLQLRVWENEQADVTQLVESIRRNQIRDNVTITVGDVSNGFDVNKDDWEQELRAWTHEAISAFRAANFPRTKQLWTSFAFGVLPTIIFFSSLMSMLYHLGIMQKIVAFFAWIMQVTLRTSGAESLSAAANIFVGQTEAPLVIRPYVSKMTQSELMAVMVGGFATIAGGVLAAYVSFGIDAGHLVTASVISAPAALLIAKVMQPETEHSVTMGHVEIAVEKKDTNLIEAAASGATDGMKLALNVGAMLIAFLAIIAMLNGIIGWMGEGVNWLLNVDWEWSMEKGLGYLFWPFAWLMGIPSDECAKAGELLGTKIVATEFVAFMNLGFLIDQGDANPLSKRTVMVLTYALCGFANFGSIGIQLGGIGGIAPTRRGDLARLGLRAMIGGTLAAFMTACVAGILV